MCRGLWQCAKNHQSFKIENLRRITASGQRPSFSLIFFTFSEFCVVFRMRVKPWRYNHCIKSWFKNDYIRGNVYFENINIWPLVAYFISISCCFNCINIVNYSKHYWMESTKLKRAALFNENLCGQTGSVWKLRFELFEVEVLLFEILVRKTYLTGYSTFIQELVFM